MRIRKILVVDDLYAEKIRDTWNLNPQQISIATTLKQAREKLALRIPDIAVLDYDIDDGKDKDAGVGLAVAVLALNPDAHVFCTSTTYMKDDIEKQYRSWVLGKQDSFDDLNFQRSFSRRFPEYPPSIEGRLHSVIDSSGRYTFQKDPDVIARTICDIFPDMKETFNQGPFRANKNSTPSADGTAPH